MAQPETLAAATLCLIPTLTPVSDVARTRAREDAVIRLLARFEAGSGKHLDDPILLREHPEQTRKRFFVDWLEEQQFTSAQFQRAEAWILRGAPAKYGSLTTADFYPTLDQLAEIEFRDDTEIRIRQAEQRGYDRGYRDGEVRCQRCHDETTLRLEIARLELEIQCIKNPF